MKIEILFLLFKHGLSSAFSLHKKISLGLKDALDLQSVTKVGKKKSEEIL